MFALLKHLPDELNLALRGCRSHFAAAAAFSLATNLLYLTLPVYMAQVYDRVLSSGRVATLVMLTIACLLALFTLSALEAVRSAILQRAGVRLDTQLNARLMSALVEQSLITPGIQRAQPLRDFDTVRMLVSGGALLTILDVPWAAVFILVLFLVHPLIGATALLSAAVLLALALLNERAAHEPLMQANAAATRGYAFADASLKNAEVIQGMGMAGALIGRWNVDRNRMLHAQTIAGDRGGALVSAIRFTRFTAQAMVLAVGAWLAIDRAITPGAMIAASILLGRAMQPVEQLVGLWRQLSAGRDALRNVAGLLRARAPRQPVISPQQPSGRVAVEDVTFIAPGSGRPLLTKVSFALQPGETLGLVGPSAAGKSTLARLLVGVYPPTAGVVRLDGASVWTWDRADFGRHVGYVPQDIELFAGTVGENIARFGTLNPEMIVRAATLAGAHEMILRLPQGYETEIGDQGVLLSGGQRQQIALARALFGEPRLLVLDEPNSNLDSNGEAVLLDTLTRLKAMAVTTVIISHRLAALNIADRLLFLEGGMVKGIGPRQEMMARLTPPGMARVAAGGGQHG